jgi:hypothetical protein
MSHLLFYGCICLWQHAKTVSDRLVVIGVDGCFLKGRYGGKLLAAVGRDPNDNIYPISMVVVEAENNDSWSWFLETLVADLGPNGSNG